MKRLLAILLAALCLLSLTACAETTYEKRGRLAAEAEDLYADGYADGYEDGYAGYEQDPVYDKSAYLDGYGDGYSDGVYVAEREFGSGLVWQETPQSTSLARIAYDETEELLAVVFRSNESRAYVYYDFSAADWYAFTHAESLGRYFNQNIKGQYSGERIEDADDLIERGIS